MWPRPRSIAPSSGSRATHKKAWSAASSAPHKPTQVMQNLHVTLDYAVARDADWVIEAATEAIALKRQIFARIEEIVPPEAMITSNTSSLPARAHLRRPASQRAGDGDLFLRAGVAQSHCRGDPLARRRCAIAGRSQLDLLHDGQGAAGHRRCPLLHARSYLRQLVQRRSPPARSRERGGDRHGRDGARARRAVLRAQSRQRQSRSSSRPIRCKPRPKASTTAPPTFSIPSQTWRTAAAGKQVRGRVPRSGHSSAIGCWAS